jgi:hypothetical protein
MDQYEFEEYLRKQSESERTEAVGRFVKNAFGVDEKIVLPMSYWRYCEWLVQTYDVNLEQYFIDCDIERGTWTLSENIMYWLHRDMTERRESGQPVPEAKELDRIQI